MSEQLLVNLRKAHAARLWFENQLGMRAKSMPEVPTLNGHPIADEKAAPLAGQPDETLLERVTRRKALDVWEPVCRVDFSSRVHEYFHGERALKMYAAWAAVVFSKQKKETA